MFKEGEYKSSQPKAGPASEAEDYKRQDYYARLGVDPTTATAEEIKQAFWELSKKHHPDRGGDTETYQYISEAYAILSVSESRAKYDRTLAVNGQQKRVVVEIKAEPPPVRTATIRRGAGGTVGQNFRDSVGHTDPFAARREREKLEQERLRDLMKNMASSRARRGQEPDNGKSAQEAANESREPETREPGAEPSELTIKKIGAYYYLIDEAGRERSSAYDKIEERDGFLMGKLLSSERLLDKRTGHALSRGYNKIFTRDGLLIGRDSLYEYPLHPETGKELSMVGYEKIEKRGNEIIGTIAGRETPIKLNEKYQETHRYSAVG